MPSDGVSEKGVDGLKTEFAAMKRAVDATRLAKIFLQHGTKNLYRVSALIYHF